MTPQRIQLRRTRGWRKPEGAIVVARPTKWGNPWVVHPNHENCGLDLIGCPEWIADSREDATTKYRHCLLYPRIGDPPLPSIDDIRYELRGHDLACWCPLDQPCHASVLLDLANQEVII